VGLEEEKHMRRVVSSTLMSLNGVIGNPHEWVGEYFDDTAAAEALAQLRRSHAMLMGRTTYEIFSRFWPQGTGEYAETVNAIRKYVYSSTLEDARWTNTTVVRDRVADHVARLKAEGDDDLVLYGHGPIGRTLLEHGLLDELKVAIHPVFVGTGTLMFGEGETSSLRHRRTATRANGVVVATYSPTDA
jgi:dihydrofolate reductase